MIADAERSGRANDPNSQTQAALENKHNMEQREQYYATVRKPGQQSPCREVSALERIPEYSEDIYPYATFNLPEQENLSANPMRQAFYYERSETMLQGNQVRVQSNVNDKPSHATCNLIDRKRPFLPFVVRERNVSSSCRRKGSSRCDVLLLHTCARTHTHTRRRVYPARDESSVHDTISRINVRRLPSIDVSWFETRSSRK